MARPDIKISLKLKDGNGERVYPAAAWKSDRGMGYNLKLDDGWKIVAPDGTEYTTGREGNCWADVFEQDNRDSAPRQPARKPAGDFGGEDFSDAVSDKDIPF